MDTHAFSFRLRASAPEGQKRFPISPKAISYESEPSIEIDNSWCTQSGVRATVSHVVHFKRTFISDADIIGYPGQYLKEGLTDLLYPTLRRDIFRSRRAAYDYDMEYMTTQKKTMTLICNITLVKC